MTAGHWGWAKLEMLGIRQGEEQGVARRCLRQIGALGLLIVVALLVLPVMASGATTTEFVKSFGPDGTAGTNFVRINGIGVDQETGDVYVLDGGAEGAIYKFQANGQKVDFTGTAPYISGNEITGLVPYSNQVNRTQVAVDSSSHVIYVTQHESVRAFYDDGEPFEFTAGPGAGTSEIPGSDELTGVAVDSNGDIYVTSQAGTVSIFAPTGEAITSFAVPSGSGNLGIGPSGLVYVANSQFGEQEGVHEFIPNEFPVSSSTTYSAGKLLPPTFGVFTRGVSVDSVLGDVYMLETHRVKKFDSSGAFVRYFGQPGEEGELDGGSGQGIAVVDDGEEFQFYVANSEAEAAEEFSKVEIFGEEVISPGPPGIRLTSAVNVSSSSVTLQAEVNPNTFATAYHFEYGLGDCSISVCASVSIVGAAIGNGHRFLAVSQNINGLQAGTAYHYRVVAENSEGVTEGPDRTFTTQSSGLGFQLADQRAWEMVSPPNKHGGRLIGTSLVQAATDGNGLAYTSLGSIEAEPEGAPNTSTALARRGTGGTWASRDITTPTDEVTPPPVGDLGEYKLFSPELARAVLSPAGSTPLSPEATERTPYLRENTDPPSFKPLVTGKEGSANVPPGTEFGGTEGGPAVSLAGASPDLSHVVIASQVPLVEGAAPAALYEWVGGQLSPISQLPVSEGGGIVRGDVGGGDLSSRHAVSVDGSRVFWTAIDTGGLYLRDTEVGESIRIDVEQPGASGAGSISPVFQAASADGQVIFFTDEQQLTEDASPEGADLYRCEIPSNTAPPACANLEDVSAPAEGVSESSQVQGFVSGLSDDGDKVYFVANGVLDEAPNQFGESATAGNANLYIWQDEQGVRFLAGLSKEDASDWGSRVGATGDYFLSTATSASGRYFAFMSERSLTGYDNRDAPNGEALQEAFRYDAVADHMECISCNPTGGLPIGTTFTFGHLSRLADPREIWNNRAVAATLPQASISTVAGPSFYRPRAVLDNGRVFFNAIDSLVPADSNGQWDVYQYEPTGVGDCSASSGGGATSRAAGGCVSLLSSGTAEEEVGFLDASVTGDDVFFMTPAQLSVTDSDREYDIYDARVDGVPATLAPNTECLGEACQSAAQAPNDPTPASAAFAGSGNVKQNRKRCGKGKHRVKRNGKTRCVKKHKHSHRRAGTSGRAGR